MLLRVVAQIVFMRDNGVTADCLNIVDGSAEADCLHDGRRASLEAMRRVSIGDVVLEHVEDHLAAALEGLRFCQPVLLAVEHADAGRAVELVAGEAVEIDVQRLHVHRQMHRALAAIDKDRNVTGMRDLGNPVHRHDRTQHVRHMGDGDKPSALRQCRLELFKPQTAIVLDRHPNELDAHALAQEMPGHDVRVVLHLRDDNLVAFFQMVHRPAIGDGVDRLGRALGENDLLHAFGIDERAHLLARRLIGFRCGIGQIMQAAMHIGIFVGIGVCHRVNNGLRLLRRGAVVEIDQRLAIHFARENREVGADGLDVEGKGHFGRLSHALPAIAR